MFSVQTCLSRTTEHIQCMEGGLWWLRSVSKMLATTEHVQCTNGTLWLLDCCFQFFRYSYSRPWPYRTNELVVGSDVRCPSSCLVLRRVCGD